MKQMIQLLLVILNVYAPIHAMNQNPAYGLAHEIALKEAYAKKHAADTNDSAQTATAAAPSPLKSHTQKQLGSVDFSS